MYIRAKHYGKRTYYSVVKTVREKNKVRQHTVCYLGKHPTIESAVAALEEEIRSVQVAIKFHVRLNFESPNPSHDKRIKQLRKSKEMLEFKSDQLEALAEKL